MVKVVDGGDLPNTPDEAGVYVIVCAFPGNTEHKLGDILYIGVSNSLRRRLGYALGAPGKGAPHTVQAPLMQFQSRGGVAKVVLCLLTAEEELPEQELEVAMMGEFEKRKGELPAWNRMRPKSVQIGHDARCLASKILDTLSVR